jgi:hypothetical protein
VSFETAHVGVDNGDMYALRSANIFCASVRASVFSGSYRMSVEVFVEYGEHELLLGREEDVVLVG